MPLYNGANWGMNEHRDEHMTVGELIDKLSKYNRDAVVVVATPGWWQKLDENITKIEQDNLLDYPISEISDGPLHASPDGHTQTAAIWFLNPDNEYTE